MAEQFTGNEKQYMISVETTKEIIRDLCIPKESITWRLSRGRYAPFILAPVSKEEYVAYMRPEYQELKKEYRDQRCFIAGKKGKLIRCPEKNKCSECMKLKQEKYISYELCIDTQYEPFTSSAEDEFTENEHLHFLLQELGRIKPEYAIVFDMLYHGYRDLEIAKRIGKPRTTTIDIIKRVRRKAQELSIGAF